MPVLKSSNETIIIPSRTAKVIREVDVLVVGGGPAGIAAAIGAAEAGAKVVIAERYGFFGGNATAGLVLTLASYYTSKGKPIQPKTCGLTLFPLDHGRGKPIVGGVLARLVEQLVKAGGAFVPSPETGFMVPFDPEIFKLTVIEMLDSSGVQILLHAFASDVIDQDGVFGVVFETKSGPIVVSTKIIVDCTGDGDIAACLGAEFEIGRLKDGSVQPMTLMFLMAGFNRANFQNYVEENPGQWFGVQGLKDLMNKASSTGELKVPRENILFFGNIHEGQVSVNSTRITNVYGADVLDLTRAEIEGRRQVAELVAFFRKYVPGFEKAYLLETGVNASVRETRRIIGEYVLTETDVLTAKKFTDVIALGSYPIDLHNPSGKGTVLKKVKAGDAYDIPLRCLIPRDIENLLVAGRCISGTHMANASYRTMPICFATGQAAGVCATLAAKSNITPKEVPASEVQSVLLSQGAILKI